MDSPGYSVISVPPSLTSTPQFNNHWMSECAYHLTNVPGEGLTPPPPFFLFSDQHPPFPNSHHGAEGGSRETFLLHPINGISVHGAFSAFPIPATVTYYSHPTVKLRSANPGDNHITLSLAWSHGSTIPLILQTLGSYPHPGELPPPRSAASSGVTASHAHAVDCHRSVPQPFIPIFPCATEPL